MWWLSRLCLLSAGALARLVSARIRLAKCRGVTRSVTVITSCPADRGTHVPRFEFAFAVFSLIAIASEATGPAVVGGRLDLAHSVSWAVTMYPVVHFGNPFGIRRNRLFEKIDARHRNRDVLKGLPKASIPMVVGSFH